MVNFSLGFPTENTTWSWFASLGCIQSRIETNFIWKMIGSMRQNFFVLKVFRSNAVLKAKLLARPIRQGVRYFAPYFHSALVCSVLPLTFAYELGLRWFMYQNRSPRRDEDNSFIILHPRSSWRHDRPKTTRNIEFCHSEIQFRPLKWSRTMIT